MYHVVGTHISHCNSNFIPQHFSRNNQHIQMAEFAGAGVVNPEKGETIKKYENLLKIQEL